MIDLKIDLDPFRKMQRDIATRVVPTISADAANRAIAAARSSARRHFSQNPRLQNRLFQAFRIQRAKAQGEKPSAALVMRGKGLPLMALNPEITEIQSRRGLRLGVRVKVGGRLVVVPGAFIARVASGHEGVFRRKTSAASSTGRDRSGRLRRGRLPIEEVLARSVLGGSEADLLADPALRARMIRAAEAVFRLAFDEGLEANLRAARALGAG